MIRHLLNKIKTINIPWSSKKFKGKDLSGNMYFEDVPINDKPYPRRTVVYADGRNHFFQYNPNDIPVQWQAWLRNTRPDPPSIQEIQDAIAYQKRIQELAANLSLKADQDVEDKPFKIPSNPSESFQPKGWNPSSTSTSRG